MGYPKNENSESGEVDEVSRRVVSRPKADSNSIFVKIRSEEKEILAQVVNYHFGGASLRLLDPNDWSLIQKNKIHPPDLDFYFGAMCVKKSVAYRIAWESLSESFCFGVQFLNSTEEWLKRPSRFRTHQKIKPTLSGFDPLEPNRKLFFNVENVSETGMLLSTSMTNKHLFPGMDLKHFGLQIPGNETLNVSLVIENTRLDSSNDSEFFLGVSIKDKREEYKGFLKSYLSALSPMENSETRARELSQSGFYSKHLKEVLSFRTVNSEKDYEKVLKLRFSGYGVHGKIKTGTDWREQGEGISKEGHIIAAYLGAQMIASMELRFGSEAKPLRYFKDEAQIESVGLKKKNIVEVNKLVVHPDIQGSDVVLGMIQKVHSVCVARGGLDIVMAATPKVAPLYLRVGAEKTGITLPHPFIENEILEVIIGRKNVYFGNENLNPLVWETVYKVVHENMIKFGLAASVKKDLFWYLKLIVTKTFLKFAKRDSKSTASQRETTTNQNGQQKRFIDPKLTEQHMVASILLPYVVEAEEKIGKTKVESILSEIGIPRDYFKSQTNWVSVEVLDQFLDKYSAFDSIEKLSERAGYRSMKKDMIGVNYYLLKHFVSPAKASLAMANIVNRFNKTRTYRPIHVGIYSATLGIGVRKGARLPKHRESCKNWSSSFKSYIELCTGHPGTVVHTACCYEGAPECVFEIGWKTNRKKILSFFELGLGPIIASVIFGVFGTVAVTFFLMFYSLIVAVRRFHEKKNQLLALEKESERFQRETTDKYSELQTAKTELDHRYREAILLDNISKELQKSSETGKLLKVALDSSCQLLSFSRAFLMLIDSEKKYLKTAAAFGVDKEISELWNFKVDVTVKRESPTLISSVFRSGSPVMIDDVETQKFQFNDASQKLVDKLSTQGFVMVAIPSSSDKNWGVIVADKVNRGESLSRKDIVLLSRVAQYLGLALDKQSKLEQEVHLRQTFQKFVPGPILENLTQNQVPTLGGDLREIFCMFLDIRGFTALSQKLPPQGLIYLLNSVFGKVHEVISKGSGNIDKFLGDGILMTWGTMGKTTPQASEVFGAAKDILRGIDTVNRQFEKEGLPTIEVGLGLHAGPAVVGNIGSPDRMEFTSIGQTVNMASRLESLCKDLGTHLVCSEIILNKLSEFERNEFTLSQLIPIRGVENKVQVGIHKASEISHLNVIKKKAA